MSMSLLYAAVTQQELDHLITQDFFECDELPLFEIDDRADLHFYSKEFIDYTLETDESLAVLLANFEVFNALPVDALTICKKPEKITAIVDAFNEIDLREFASDMGYDEDEHENASASNSLYKTLIDTKNFFEKASLDNKIIISWIM